MFDHHLKITLMHASSEVEAHMLAPARERVDLDFPIAFVK